MARTLIGFFLLELAGLACTSSPAASTPCEPLGGWDAGLYGGGNYPISDLPSGACSGSNSCQMNIVVLCDAGGYLVDEYQCSCVDDAWQCSDKYPDLALCVTVDSPAD